MIIFSVGFSYMQVIWMFAYEGESLSFLLKRIVNLNEFIDTQCAKY